MKRLLYLTCQSVVKSRLEKRQCLCRISHREVFFLPIFPEKCFRADHYLSIFFSRNMEKWQKATAHAGPRKLVTLNEPLCEGVCLRIVRLEWSGADDTAGL